MSQHEAAQYFTLPRESRESPVFQNPFSKVQLYFARSEMRHPILTRSVNEAVV
jgi:hypothetical protein